MEGIQTINALKAVQSSLPAQTTIPSDELVMLYAADGTPIAKIARDDLVKAVASVMASNSQTTFSKLLGVQANGTPMGIGPSDLASVLGDTIHSLRWAGNLADLDNIDETCYGYYNGHSDEDGLFLTLVLYTNNTYNKQYRLQIKTNDSGSTLKYRTMNAGVWGNWQLINHTEMS